jgi:hypothetical protein
MDQSVMNFATVAARSSAIPTPTTGMVSYVGDTGSDSITGGTIVDVPQIQAYTGAAWQNMEGLTLIAKATIGTGVSSITMSNVFSNIYDNYKILVSGGSASTSGNFNLVLSGITSNYFSNLIYQNYAVNAVIGTTAGPGASFSYAGNFVTTGISIDVDIYSPFLVSPTKYTSKYADLYTSGGGAAGSAIGLNATTTSVTGFTLNTSSGTITGGSINVYGFRKS